MPGSCGLIGGPASSVAQNGLEAVQNYADNAIQRVIESSGALSSFLDGITPIRANINLGDRGSLSSPFSAPVKPLSPNTAFIVPEVGYDPEIGTINYARTVTAPGDFTKGAPFLSFGDRPGPVTHDAPGAAPTVNERAMPAAPTDDIPPLPDLRNIQIPTAAQLTLPTFEGILPADFEVGEIPSFSWSEDTYVGTVQTEVVTQITAILGGSTGIPDAIWDAIWARTRRQASKQANLAIEQAKERWSAMGHMVPNGAERKRVKEAEDIFNDQVGEAAREQAVQDARITVERLNTALAQGIALEGQLLALHGQQAQRALQTAQLMVTLPIQVAELKISAYNARMGAYAQQAQVFVSIMQGELAKLEIYKTELEGQKLISQLNLQDLEAYKTRIQALEASYSLYTEQVKAVIGQYDADKTRVQAYSEQVKAFASIHAAKEAEWKGYAETVRAELGKVEVFKVESDVHLNRMRGYEIGTNADQADAATQIEVEKLKLERLRASLDEMRTNLSGEVERVRSLTSAYDSEARVYSAGGSIEQSRVASDDRRFEVLMRDAQIRADVETSNLKLGIDQGINLTNLQIQGYTNVLNANSQVGSSALAALNFSATISDRVANSTSCSTTFDG